MNMLNLLLNLLESIAVALIVASIGAVIVMSFVKSVGVAYAIGGVAVITISFINEIRA